MSSVIKSIQRGTIAGAGNVTISAVTMAKTTVKSFSNSSAGNVAGRGSITLTPSGGYVGKEYEFGTGITSGSFPSYSGSFSGGSTDLITKEYGAKLTSTTNIYCSGACIWEVIEYI